MKIQTPSHLDLSSFRYEEMASFQEKGLIARELAQEYLEAGKPFDHALQTAVEEIITRERSLLKPGGKLRLLEKPERHRLIYFLQVEDDMHLSDADILERALLKHLEGHFAEAKLMLEEQRQQRYAKPYATPPQFELERLFREFQDRLHARARHELREAFFPGMQKAHFVEQTENWLMKQEIELEVARYLEKQYPNVGNHHEKLLPELLIFLRMEYHHLLKAKKKRKWWNPFTWF